MKRLKLKKLLNKYKHEMANGDFSHLKDLIAVLVLLNYSCGNMGSYKLNYNMNDINLEKLIYGISMDREYEVPSIEVLDILNKKYKKIMRSKSNKYNQDGEYAATTWISLMVNFGMLEEGQVIKPKDYVIADFMSDDKLLSMFDTNEISITNYKRTLRKN